MNQHQKKVFKKYKRECRKLYEDIWKIGLVVNPGSYLYSRIDSIDELLDMDDSRN